MMLYKVLLSFKTTLVIAVLCISIPSKADDACIWCEGNINKSVNCMIDKFSNYIHFPEVEHWLRQMKNDLLGITSMVHMKDATKKDMIKRTLITILWMLTGTENNSKQKIGFIINIMRECGITDKRSLEEVEEMIINRVKENSNQGSPNAYQPNVYQPYNVHQSPVYPIVYQPPNVHQSPVVYQTPNVHQSSNGYQWKSVDSKTEQNSEPPIASPQLLNSDGNKAAEPLSGTFPLLQAPFQENSNQDSPNAYQPNVYQPYNVHQSPVYPIVYQPPNVHQSSNGYQWKSVDSETEQNSEPPIASPQLLNSDGNKAAKLLPGTSPLLQAPLGSLESKQQTELQNASSMIEDKTTKALDFFKCLNELLNQSPAFKIYCNEDKTNKQMKSTLNLILPEVMKSCKFSQKIVQDIYLKFIDLKFPNVSSSETCAKILSLTFTLVFYENDLIRNPPVDAKTFANAFIKALKLSVSEDNNKKPDILPQPLQNLLNSATQNTDFNDGPSQQLHEISGNSKEKNSHKEQEATFENQNKSQIGVDNEKNVKSKQKDKSKANENSDFYSYLFPSQQTLHIQKWDNYEANDTAKHDDKYKNNDIYNNNDNGNNKDDINGAYNNQQNDYDANNQYSKDKSIQQQNFLSKKNANKGKTWTPDFTNTDIDNSDDSDLVKKIKQQNDNLNPQDVLNYDDNDNQNSKPSGIEPNNINKSLTDRPTDDSQNADLTKANNTKSKNNDTPFVPSPIPNMSNDSENSDSKKNTTVKDKTESKKNEEFLEKCILECIKDRFDYPKLANCMAVVMKDEKEKHPDWEDKKIQGKCFVLTIYALIQKMMKFAKITQKCPENTDSLSKLQLLPNDKQKNVLQNNQNSKGAKQTEETSKISQPPKPVNPFSFVNLSRNQGIQNYKQDVLVPIIKKPFITEVKPASFKPPLYVPPNTMLNGIRNTNQEFQSSHGYAGQFPVSKERYVNAKWNPFSHRVNVDNTMQREVIGQSTIPVNTENKKIIGAQSNMRLTEPISAKNGKVNWLPLQRNGISNSMMGNPAVGVPHSYYQRNPPNNAQGKGQNNLLF